MCEGWYTLGECVKHGIPLGNKHVEFQFAHIRATKRLDPHAQTGTVNPVIYHIISGLSPCIMTERA